jgi:DNA-binding LytR/AlgR family response regulator
VKIKVIIVDDEPRAIKILEGFVSRIAELELVCCFTDAIATYNFIKNNKVDLVLLDITMPEVDGFAFLRMLHEPPLAIFTTAHPEFAVQSYEYQAIDYLVKPIPFERFRKAIDKAVSLLSLKAPERHLPDTIDLKINGQMVSISFAKIKYFQSLGNYIKVITLEKTLFTQVTTKEIEDALPVELFIRIHKSFIVNKSKITKMYEDEILLDDIKLPIGKTFKKYVRNATVTPP